MNCHITRPNYAESASSSGNILDLVLTNNDSLIEETAVYPYTFDSDHFPVYFTVKNKFNTIRKVYRYGKADFDGLRNTLSYVSWDSFISCDDINSSVFQDLVTEIVTYASKGKSAKDPIEKASLFSDFFSAVFSTITPDFMEFPCDVVHPDLLVEVSTTRNQVRNILGNLNLMIYRFSQG